MKQTLQIFALLIGLAVPAIAEDIVPGGITEVSAEYSTGWIGRIYSIWLKADGTAVFRGERQITRLGVFQAQFPKEEFKKLAAFLLEQDYTSFTNEYNRTGTDGACFLLKITAIGKKPKEILVHNPHDESAPPKFWAIKHIIESITANLPWQEFSNLSDKVEPTDPAKIIIPEFKIPEQLPGNASLQRVTERILLYSREFDPYARGISIILDIPEAKRTRETLAIDLKNQSILQILNHVASLEGLILARKGRTIVIQERQGAL